MLQRTDTTCSGKLAFTWIGTHATEPRSCARTSLSTPKGDLKARKSNQSLPRCVEDLIADADLREPFWDWCLDALADQHQVYVPVAGTTEHHPMTGNVISHEPGQHR